MSSAKKKKSTNKIIILVSTAIALVFILAGFFIIKGLLSDDGTKRKRQVQMVSLMKPPPPQKVEELPPPELKEKEEIIEQQQEEQFEEIPDDAGPDQEAGSDLGLDAEGVAGSDGFGLVSKKGGSALIGGGSGDGGLLKRFAWYTSIIQDQIQERLQKELERDGGIPKGEYEATVRVVLNDIGNIVSCQIVGSSGNLKMDSAINKSVKNVRADEPPPFDMPRAIKLKISSRG